MPIYEFYCQTCNEVFEQLCSVGVNSSVHACGSRARRVPSRPNVIVQENIGRKLRTRVALDDELKKQGIAAPLFKSELSKDKVRWLLKKAGVK